MCFEHAFNHRKRASVWPSLILQAFPSFWATRQETLDLTHEHTRVIDPFAS